MLKINELHVGNEMIRDNRDIKNNFNEYFVNLSLMRWDKYMKNVDYTTMFYSDVDECFVYNIVSTRKIKMH